MFLSYTWNLTFFLQSTVFIVVHKEQRMMYDKLYGFSWNKVKKKGVVSCVFLYATIHGEHIDT